MQMSLIGNKARLEMTQLFAPTRYLQRAAIPLGSIIIIVLTSITADWLPSLFVRIVFALGIYAALEFAVYVFCKAWANRLLNKVLFTLSEACDPLGYINAVLKMQKLQQGQDRGNIYYCKLLLSKGYLNAGDFATAESVLDNLRLDESFASDTFRVQCAVAYHLIKSTCAIQRQDYTAAQACIDSAVEALNTTHPDTRNYVLYHYNIEQAQNTLRLHQGDYQSALAFFHTDFSKATSRLGRVTSKYNYALAAQGCGQTEQAAEALEYVVENGGKTNHVQLAEQALAQMAL